MIRIAVHPDAPAWVPPLGRTVADLDPDICCGAPNPDVVLLGLRTAPWEEGAWPTFPARNGRRTGPVRAQFVHGNWAELVWAIELGVEVVLCVGAPETEWLTGIRAGAAGKRFLSPRLMDAHSAAVRLHTAYVRFCSCSEEVRKVAPFVALGLTDEEVAAELERCESTVKKHTAALREVFGVARRPDLAVFLARHSFLLRLPAP